MLIKEVCMDMEVSPLKGPAYQPELYARTSGKKSDFIFAQTNTTATTFDHTAVPLNRSHSSDKIAKLYRSRAIP